MTGPLRRWLRAVRASRRDAGQLTILVLGLMVVALVVVLGGIDATAAQIARTRLLDAADAVALDAADAIDEQGTYARGLGSTVTVSTQTVLTSAEQGLADRPRPSGVTAWRLGPGSGSPDGRSAVVVVQGDVDLPFTSGVLAALGSSVTVTVVGRARSDLR